jgi:hypothetical protein
MLGGREQRGGFEKRDWVGKMEVKVGREVAGFCELEGAGE